MRCFIPLLEFRGDWRLAQSAAVIPLLGQRLLPLACVKKDVLLNQEVWCWANS